MYISQVLRRYVHGALMSQNSGVAHPVHTLDINLGESVETETYVHFDVYNKKHS